MMNKTTCFFIALAALSAAALASCAKAEWESTEGKVVIDNPNPPERRIEFVSFPATLEGSWEAKSSLDLDITKKMIWEKGDRVLVRDAEGHQAIYAASAGGSASTELVRVSGDTLSVNGPYEAWYPESYVGGELPSKVSFETQKAVRECPMSATGMKALDFKTSCAAVSCLFNPESAEVVKQIIISADQPLCEGGELTYDFTAKSPSGMSFSTTAKNTFTFFAREGSYTNLTFKFINDNTVLENITLGFALNLEKGTIATVDLNSPDGRFYNLGRGGTANCYIVAKAGEYLFPAVKGPTTEPVEDVADVKILWQARGKDVTLDAVIIDEDSVRFENGKVYFTIPESSSLQIGNVLIGAVDAKDSTLWSWHIWVVNDNPSAQRYDTAGKYFLMDRSLGTLAKPYNSNIVNNDSFTSLLYQYGRKDPLVGFCCKDPYNRMVPFGSMQPISAKGPVSSGYAAAHPNAHFYGDSLWCSDQQHPVWSSTVKTQQDPCPPGYIVAPLEAFTDETGPFHTGSHGSSFTSYYGHYKFGGVDALKDLYLYPCDSPLQGLDGKRWDVKHSVYIWCAEAEGKTAPAIEMTGTNTVTVPVYHPLSDALTVRCMKIIEED